jgi:hypothetical protein
MLNQWKQYINDEEFKILIDFILNTNESIKINKFICLFGNKEKTDKLLSDIYDIIKTDNIHYCKKNPLTKVPLKEFYAKHPEEQNVDNESGSDSEIEENNTEFEENNKTYISLDSDEDDQEYSMFYEYDFYIKNKLLIFDINVFMQSIPFVKQVLGNDTMSYYNNSSYQTFIPTCNIIIQTDDLKLILEDKSVYLRSLIINIK